MIESQQSLYNSNLFRRATIVLPPRGDSAKLIDINVTEARLHAVRLSAGFSTIDFIQTEGKFTNYNFLGDARRLDLHLVVSNLLAPALNGTGIFRDVLADNGLPGDCGARLSQSELPGERRCHAALDRRSAQHGRASVCSRIARASPASTLTRDTARRSPSRATSPPRSPLSLVYRYELTQVEAGDVYFCVNYGVCELTTIGLLRNRNALSPVSLDFFMDRTDVTLNPHERLHRARRFRACVEVHAVGFPIQSRHGRGHDVSPDRDTQCSPGTFAAGG